MNRVLLALALFILPAAGMAQDDSDGPLLHMLEQIPAGAQGIVSLSDVAASKRQIHALSETTSEPTHKIAPYGALYYRQHGFYMGSFSLFTGDGAKSALGFSIFDIEQIAGWGELPAAPAIIAGVAERAGNIEAALLARKFEITDYNGHKVWHRGRNFQKEIEPFGIMVNTSQRFAVKDGFLLFARGWPMMHRILDADSSLADDPDAVAILRAGYAVDDVGDLIDVALLLGQPEAAPGATPGLPPFTRYGLLLWQHGAATTGAIAIPYADAATAMTARDRFTARLDTLYSPIVGRRFADILPWPRRIEIVETSGYSVLILGFQSQADTSQPVTAKTFMRTPRRRLLDLARTRDLDLLIGRSE